ncbi:HIT family protein [Patescibacteria group bacterium]|nr:HIT family protein [Patescibacteria group bacterium]MBU4057394.1 HIT family protein [Patescibacteria group bacterium]MBU4115621.1 HIT family protein [Patescibacteria group bacterium]
MECIFCKIIKGEIPCHKVYEDENFFAFLDINPLNPGHSLLVPKKHFEWVNDYEPFGEYWETARKLSWVIQKALDSVLVSYIVYGLGVPHAHIHLIPKFEGDQHSHGPNPEKIYKCKDGEMKEVAEKIKKELR